MLSRGRLLFILVSLLVLLLVVGGSLTATTARDAGNGNDSLYKYISLFVEVLQLIDRAYVEKTESEALIAGAVEGATDALDPFSLYVPPARVESYLSSREIGAGRSGLVVLKERGVAYAMAVIPGSPAAEAGLERGDLLGMIQGRSTREMPLWAIRAMLSGAPGTRIEIQRLRLGQQAQVELVLADFPPPGVVLEVQRGVAILRPGIIDENTVENMDASLAAVLGESAGPPELTVRDKLVLDLRSVAAGDAKAAYGVAALFTGEGEIGVLSERGEILETFSGAGEPHFRGRLVVLVNRGTQGAAEVLATVLRQRVEAELIGEPTFGHSGRESLLTLSNGGRLQITSAFFTGPDRAPIDTALEPDLVVRPRPFSLEEQEDEEKDPILERALSLVLGEEELPEAEVAA